MLTRSVPIVTRVGGVPEIVRETPAEKYLFAPGNIDEFVDRVEALTSQSKDNITDAVMKLREHTPMLFNKEEIENKLTGLFESMLGQDKAK
jgi:glycosyltransferase involved in cell wall biosynthesis